MVDIERIEDKEEDRTHGGHVSAAILTFTYRQTPIFLHPFFRKQCFSLKYVLVALPQKFLEVCLNSEYM